ncbi:MAG: hypothetical protein U0169_25690 [Polyangiaceae bacterium]
MRRWSSKRGRFAAVRLVAGACLVACSGADPTSIALTPRSTIALSSAVVVVRVFGSTGRLDFCGEYPVDETRPPGDTVSLVDAESTLKLVPRSMDAARVRIVSELFDGATWVPGARCNGGPGASPDPLVRKVSIVSFAEGKALTLAPLFDASCIGITSCDEVTSTCERGVCTSAEATATEGRVGDGAGCFDLAACPTLAPATRRTSPCSFVVPRPIAEGYVAVTFRVDTGTSGDAVTRGITVVDPKDVVGGGAVEGGYDVELTGTACTLVSGPAVSDVFFGYACSPPSSGQALCTKEDAPSASTGGTGGSGAAVLLDAVRSPPGRPDAGTGPDASAPDAANTDATVTDATSNDATSNDGATADAGDAGSDASDVGDGGSPPADSGSDASDAGSDAADSGGGIGRGVQCPATSGLYCGAPNANYCCLSTHVCVNGPTCATDRAECDDTADCPTGTECCREVSGPYVGSACRATGTCLQGTGKQVLCSDDDPSCPAGSTCTLVRPQDSHLRKGCVPVVPRVEVLCPLGAPSAACADALPVCCERVSGASQTSCSDSVAGCDTPNGTVYTWTCDDKSDCPAPGDVCCITDSAVRSSTCTPGTMCAFTASSRPACSSSDQRCPGLSVCLVADPQVTGQVQRYCERAD